MIENSKVVHILFNLLKQGNMEDLTNNYVLTTRNSWNILNMISD